jgi:hypothetical protein
VGFRGTLLPLAVSFALVVLFGIRILKLYQRYDREIEEARLKYSGNEDFVIDGLVIVLK